MNTYKIVLFCVVLLFGTCAVNAGPIEKYHLTASNENNFAWFRVAKVGMRTVLKMLKEAGVKFSVNKSFVPYKAKQYKSHFKFAFVRNPWDRVVSCYCDKVLKKRYPAFASCYGKNFSYFVAFINRQNLANADRHIKLQTQLFPHKKVDFIGRFENFSRDLQYVFKKIGLKNVVIPRMNSTDHPHYSTFYDEYTKRIIANKYKADIEAFDYAFETQ